MFPNIPSFLEDHFAQSAQTSKVRQCYDGCGDSGLDQRDAILPPKSRGLGTIRWQDESCNNDCPIAIARVPGNVVL